MLLAFVALLALNACGGIKDGDMENPDQPDDPPADPITAVAEAYGLDLDSTAEQSMSTELTDSDTLRSIVHDYLQGFTFFSGSEMENLTYDDFKNEIGVDATNYCCREEGSSRMNMFTWIASDDATVKFSTFFRDGKLYATGSTNTNID